MLTLARRKKAAFVAAGQIEIDDSPNLSSLSQGVCTDAATTGRSDAIDLAKHGGNQRRRPKRLRAAPGGVRRR
jgi:hypothetical protein